MKKQIANTFLENKEDEYEEEEEYGEEIPIIK